MEQTENFKQAFGLLNFKVYEQAISLFQSDLKENPLNLASYHNIGLAQIYLGIDRQNPELLKEAIKNLEKAIEISKNLHYENGYPSAEANLTWAKEELAKFK
jgi:tetratricopeptide (TPR) repeat protein